RAPDRTGKPCEGQTNGLSSNDSRWTIMPGPLQISFANEHELIGVALALIGDRSALSPQERLVASGIRASHSAELITATRNAIKVGHDPLGAALIHLRTARSRRAL